MPIIDVPEAPDLSDTTPPDENCAIVASPLSALRRPGRALTERWELGAAWAKSPELVRGYRRRFRYPGFRLV
jgi:hypothetical protein